MRCEPFDQLTDAVLAADLLDPIADHLVGHRLRGRFERGGIAPREPAVTFPLIPFDSAAKKVLELTFRQALRLGHNYVGTEHILFALLEAEEDDGPLHRLGGDWDRFERELAAALAPPLTKN